MNSKETSGCAIREATPWWSGKEKRDMSTTYKRLVRQIERLQPKERVYQPREVQQKVVKNEMHMKM